MNVTRPENKLLKACSSSFVYDRCVYDKACIGMPMSIQTPRDMEAAYTWHKWHQATHAPTHCLPSIQCQQTTLSHTHRHPTLAPSLTEAPWARQMLSSSHLGTRRGGSQPSHSPPAHARCVHQHAHACAPCTCAMHMHVCTVCVCLCGRVGSVCVCVCVGRG